MAAEKKTPVVEVDSERFIALDEARRLLGDWEEFRVWQFEQFGASDGCTYMARGDFDRAVRDANRRAAEQAAQSELAKYRRRWVWPQFAKAGHAAARDVQLGVS